MTLHSAKLRLEKTPWQNLARDSQCTGHVSEQILCSTIKSYMYV